jgi:diguanylate cyclase (GGDEF)-like protein
MARYGGEELVLLLPDTDVNTAKKIAHKLREIVECHKFYFNDEQVKITVSVGLAEIKINGTKKNFSGVLIWLFIEKKMQDEISVL